MATVPSQDNWSAGEFPTAAKLNKNIRDAVNFLMNPPEARLARKLTAQTGLGNGSTTAIIFDSTLLDNDSMTNIATANTRITITTAGAYNVGVAAQLVVGADLANARWMQLSIRKNGGVNIATSVMPQYGVGLGSGMSFSIPNNCVAGDYFEIVCNSAGSAFQTNAVGDGAMLYARWIGN
ncbi:hypothetical protein [Amycolatopsis sp. lyj-112]|uniref:hypothetical protein n=1 Tax=Amycolatopsis sp. lyj-112 TaxID=2789288 RepID=UPI00397C3F39